MARPRIFRLHDLPIPPDAAAHPKWPLIMLDLAAHIGAYSTLLIVDAFPGQDIYVPLDPGKSPFLDVIERDKAAILAQVFGRERITIPSGTRWIAHAKRQGIIASVRQNRLSVVEAAAMLGKPRTDIYRLLTRTDEGLGHAPMILTARRTDPRQIEMFGE